MEGGFRNETEGGKEIVTVEPQNDDAPDDVAECHERNQHAADSGDALDAAQQDGCHQGANHSSGESGRKMIGVMGKGGDGIRLYRVAYAERGNGGEEGKKNCHETPAQSAFQGIHRTAKHAPLRRGDAIFDGEQAFGIFCSDAEDAREPAPEHSAGTAQGDGGGNADDVARTDGGCQGGGKRGELRHIANTVGVFLHRKFDGGEDPPLRKTQTNGEKNVSAEKQDYHGPAPQPPAQHGKEIADGFHLW